MLPSRGRGSRTGKFPVPSTTGQGPSRSSKSKRGATSESHRHPKRRRAEVEEDEPELIDEERETFLQISKRIFRKGSRLHLITPISLPNGNLSRAEKKIALSLAENCKYHSQRGTWIYRVRLRTFTHIRRVENDGVTISITILRKSAADEENSDSNNEGYSTILESLITSRESSRFLSNQSSSRSNSPLLAVCGPETVFKAIKSTLEGIFSCIIFPLKCLNSDDIKFIFGRFLIFAVKNGYNFGKPANIVIEFIHCSKGKLLKYEGHIPARYFEDVIICNDEAVTSREVRKMWFNVFEAVEDPMPATSNTSIAKIKYPIMRVAQNGVVRAKIDTEDVLLDLIANLNHVLQRGTGQNIFTRRNQ